MSDQNNIYEIRKWCEFFEETHYNESGKKADGEPIRKFAIGAVIKNPYANKFSKNLDLLINPSYNLGKALGKRLLKCSKGFPIFGYGKSCIVGTEGEYEHGNACLTTVFADPIRECIGGAKSWIPSTGKVGFPGAQIDIPLAHKDAIYVRSYYDTFTISVNDSPKPNEILILFAASTRGRLHARLGGLNEKDIIGEDGLK